MTLLLGAVADDFTGATDLANTLVREGMRATQLIGVPAGAIDIGDAEAVVIALKSRTAPVAEAVAESLAAARWLSRAGARQLFFKYCSTFDSTPSGNIGPVADALRSFLDVDVALVCPASPENGRTVYQGHLFVGDRLLSDSSMKDHPLTPMRDANLIRLMEAQCKGDVALIPLDVVRQGPQAIERSVAQLRADSVSYGVVDAIGPDDLRAIGAAARHHKLVTGGSGVAMGLPANLRSADRLGDAAPSALPVVPGRELVLAGSCSTATRAQIAFVRDRWPSRKIDLDAVAAGHDVVSEVCQWAMRQPAATPVLVYGSSDPDEVARNQATYGVTDAGEMMERTLAGIARTLTAHGFTRLVSAGGETSGAIVSALAVRGLQIGREIAPGVPWTTTLTDPPMALALKSGNFGAETFFEIAFSMLP